MKKMLFPIIALLPLVGCCQDLKKIGFKIQNKENVILDSVTFFVDNQTDDTLKVYFSLYVKDENKWTELLNDIYNNDRESLKKISIGPKSKSFFSYKFNDIHPLYKTEIGNSPLRIEMVGFYKDFKKGVYRIHTDPFRIKD